MRIIGTMRNLSPTKLAILGILLSILALGTGLTLLFAQAAVGPKLTDHTLFFTNSTPTDRTAFCTSSKPFVVYISFRNVGTGTVNGAVKFLDDDTYGFTLAPNEVFSTTQAAGDTPGVDTTLFVVGPASGSGVLSGWMSAHSLAGSTVSCGVIDIVPPGITAP